MATRMVIVEHFTSMDDVERAREVLEDAGMQPVVVDEARRDSEGVFALQVPEEDAERAEELLEQAVPPEEVEAMETLNDLERESDERDPTEEF